MLNLPEPDAVPSLYTRDIAHKLLYIQTEPDRPTEDGRGYILGKLIGQPAGWATYLDDSNPVKFDAELLPSGATVQRLGTGTLVMLGQDPADPPLSDVLEVRRAMGYPVPTQHELSEDVGASSAGRQQPLSRRKALWNLRTRANPILDVTGKHAVFPARRAVRILRAALLGAISRTTNDSLLRRNLLSEPG